MAHNVCVLVFLTLSTRVIPVDADDYVMAFHQISGAGSSIKIYLYNPNSVSVTYSLTSPNLPVASGGISQLNQVLAANTGTSISISNSFLLDGSGSDINRGLLVRTSSSVPLSIIGTTHVTFGGDSYTARPVAQLGTQYIVVSSILRTSLFDSVGPYVFSVMATQPNTKVVIQCRSQSSSLTLSSGAASCSKGGTMTLNLNQYQTAEIKGKCCDSTAINGGDPSGSLITSNYPIFATSGAGNSFIDSGTISADHLTELLPRVDELGSKYVVVPSTDGDYVVIVAVNAGTTYTVTFNSGSTTSGTLLVAGSTASFAMSSSDYVYIAANSRVMVAQLARVNTFMTIPTAIDRPDVMSTSYAYNTPAASTGSYGSLYIWIVAATADLCGLALNGAFLSPSVFKAVSTSKFSAARISISSGNGKITHSYGRPFYAYMFGTASLEGMSTVLPSWNVSSAPYYQPGFCAPTTVKPTVKTTTAVATTTTRPPTTTARKMTTKAAAKPLTSTAATNISENADAAAGTAGDAIAELTLNTSSDMTPTAGSTEHVTELTAYSNEHGLADHVTDGSSSLSVTAEEVEMSSSGMFSGTLITEAATTFEVVKGVSDSVSVTEAGGVFPFTQPAIPRQPIPSVLPPYPPPDSPRSSYRMTLNVNGSSMNESAVKEQLAQAGLTSFCLPLPTAVDNAVTSLYLDMYGAVMSVRCRNGYQLSDGGSTRSVVCKSTFLVDEVGFGTWPDPRPRCKAIKCPDKVTVLTPIETSSSDNTVAASSSLSSATQQSATVATTLTTLYAEQFAESYCPAGQVMFATGLGLDVTKCTAVAKLQSTARCTTNCTERGCVAPPSFDNSIGVFNPFLRTFAVQCSPGYRFTCGKRYLVYYCDHFGMWDWNNLDNCLEMYCPSLAAPVNGSLSTSSVRYQTLVTATCIEGYIFPDYNLTHHVQCIQMEDRNNTDIFYLAWNSTVENCTAVFCSGIQPIKNGMTEPIDVSSKQPYAAIVTCQCNNGRRFEDGYKTKQIRCTNNGQWNDTLLTCDYERCDVVPEIVHATHDTRLSLNGTVVHYTCDVGYWFTPISGKATTGNKTDWNNVTTVSRRCNGSEWTDVAVECTVIQCPALDSSHSTLSSLWTAYGTLVTIQCDEGYRIAGLKTVHNLTVNCTGRGHWFPAFRGCQPVDCGPIPTVDKRVVTSWSNLTTFGNTVIYGCVKDYYFGHELFAMSTACDSSGKWTPANLKCIECRCKPLLTQRINTTRTSVNTSVNASCLSAQTWMRNLNVPSIVSKCDQYGRWQPDIPSCLDNVALGKAVFKKTESPNGFVFGAAVYGVVSTVVVLLIVGDLRPVHDFSKQSKAKKPLRMRRRRRRPEVWMNQAETVIGINAVTLEHTVN